MELQVAPVKTPNESLQRLVKIGEMNLKQNAEQLEMLRIIGQIDVDTQKQLIGLATVQKEKQNADNQSSTLFTFSLIFAFGWVADYLGASTYGRASLIAFVDGSAYGMGAGAAEATFVVITRFIIGFSTPYLVIACLRIVFRISRFISIQTGPIDGIR